MPRTKDACIRVCVTGGDIRNGRVCIRDYLWFFPKNAIRGERVDQGEPATCTLDLDEFGVVETDIDGAKGIFRWRGWKKFFARHKVVEGDQLVFSRLGPNRFGVRVEPAVLSGLSVSAAHPEPNTVRQAVASRKVRHCNDLSGDEWLRCSLSIWSDIRKTTEETALGHPAMFPTMLCERLIAVFLRREGKHRVLDPFMGSGSTLLAARNLGKIGVGLDISESYVRLARRRLEEPNLFEDGAPPYEIHQADARRLLEHVSAESIDLCITSPPYWDILNQRRTADYKEVRHYGNLDADLGIIPDYAAFLDELASVFTQVLQVLRPGAYCVVVVMDLRKKRHFYALHSDLARRMVEARFVYDDLIIWDRAQEYNNLRPLGYPAVFRVNKIHEYILVFQKAAES